MTTAREEVEQELAYVVGKERASALVAAVAAEQRAQGHREAADLIAPPDITDDCGCGGCDACAVKQAADILRVRADQIEQETGT